MILPAFAVLCGAAAVIFAIVCRAVWWQLLLAVLVLVEALATWIDRRTWLNEKRKRKGPA